MSTIQTLEGDFKNVQGQYAIAVGRFNEFVVESLVSGAIDALTRHGVARDQITIAKAPGAYELPLVCQSLANSGKYDAFIAIGAVIRGGTPHFEYVSGPVASALGSISLDTGVPVVFSVLTVDRRASDRTCRHQSRQQGCRCRHDGHGDGFIARSN